MVLLTATVLLGLMAGLFFGYANSVMPGLRRADDRTVVDVMQRFNTAIQNGLFLVLFVGALPVTGAAAWLQRGSGAFWPALLAAGLYAATLAVTLAVNVPLNNRLAAAGPADQLTDPRAVRAAFYDRWVRWNLLRTLTCAGAFTAACWALTAR